MDSRVMFSFKFSLQYQAIEDVMYTCYPDFTFSEGNTHETNWC